MADLSGFGSNFAVDSLASQQAALARAQQLLQLAPPTRKGELFATVLGQRVAANKAKRQEETEARTLNSIQAQVLDEAQAAGGPVDLQQMQVQVMLRGAQEFAQQGNAARAREMFQQAAALQTQHAASLAEIDKFRSEAEENRRPPQSNAPEIVRLQGVRGSLRERLAAVEAGVVPGNAGLITKQIDELDKRITSIIEGRTTTYDGTLTSGSQTAATNTLLAYQDQLDRLYRVRDSFAGQEQLLTPQGKLGVLWAMGKDRFGNAAPADKEAIRGWVDLQQSAMSQINLTLKELSGAAVSNQEYDRQLAVELNPGSLSNPFSGDRPEEFAQKLKNKIAWAEAAADRYAYLIQEGRIGNGDRVTDAIAEELPLTMFGAPADGASGAMSLEDLLSKYPGQ